MKTPAQPVAIEQGLGTPEIAYSNKGLASEALSIVSNHDSLGQYEMPLQTVRRDSRRSAYDRGMSTVGGVALIAGVAVLGVIGKNLWDSTQCVHSPRQFIDCLNFSPNTESKPTQPVFTGFEKTGEQLIGTASMLTFGTGEVHVAGKGHLDYDVGFWSSHKNNALGVGVDGTMKLEATAEHPAILLYEPCLQISPDYTKMSLAGPLVDPVEAAAAVGNDQPLETTLTITYEPDPANPSVPKKIKVYAGTLMACHMRLDYSTAEHSAANEAIYIPADEMGAGHIRLFRAMSSRLLTAYGEAAACPGSISDLDAVKAEIITVARGFVDQKNPTLASLSNDKYEVELDTADNHRDELNANFQAVLAEENAITRTLPDTKGKDHPIKHSELSMEDFALVECPKNLPGTGFHASPVAG